jgi:hypothetical protein
MVDFDTLWPWLTLGLLGAFHGLNPGMGWLFAVALGLQERRLRAVVAALGPIALGHALAIGVAAVVVGALGMVIPPRLLLALGGAALLAFAAYKILTRFRHPRWVGMRVSARDLVLWSFLMASAHGAGLKLAPAVVLLRPPELPRAMAAAGHADHAGHMLTGPVPHAHAAELGSALAPAIMATALHTAAMVLVMGVVAVAVYRVLGVDLLRRAWINLDLIWVGALTITGLIALGFGMAPFVIP